MTYQISESQADVIAIEDLNVKGMLKNHRLASSISEASFSEIRRQLEYKCARKGKALMVIPRPALPRAHRPAAFAETSIGR